MIKQHWDYNYVKLFADISESLLKEKELNNAIDAVIKLLGLFFQVDRAYLFVSRQEKNQRFMDYTNEWCADGIEAFIGTPELTDVTFDMLPDVMSEMLKNKVMYGNVNDHPSETFKEIMNAQSITSYLFSPLVIEDKLFGFVGFDSCVKERIWYETEANYLSSLGSIIAHRFLRDREKNILELKLKEEEELNKLLIDIDFIKSMITGNKATNEIFRQLTLVVQKYLNTDLLILSDIELLEEDSATFAIQKFGVKVGSKFKILSNERLQIIGKEINTFSNTKFTIKDIMSEKFHQKNRTFINNISVSKTNITASKLTEVLLHSGNLPIGYMIVGSANSVLLKNKNLKIENAKVACENILNFLLAEKNKTKYEQTIRDSESRFRLISENSNDIIAIHSLDGAFRYISPSFKNILGFDSESYINKTPYSLLASEKASTEIRNFIYTNDFSRELPRVTFKFKTRDNEYKYLQTSFSSLYENGEISEMISISRDVSNEIISNKALKLSERKFRLISSNLTEIIALHDHDHTCIWISPSVEKILGFTPEELIGKAPLSLLEKEGFKIIHSDASTGIQRIETRHKAKCGKSVDLEIISRPFKDDELNIDGRLSIIRDITERKSYQNRLEIQKNSFERIFEETLSGYVEIYPHINLVFISPKFLSILGYSETENLNHNKLFMEAIFSDDYSNLNEAIKKTGNNFPDTPIVVETRYWHRNGEEINILFAGQVLEQDADHKPIKIIGCNIDMTYIKKIESQLFKSRTALELVLKKTKQVVWIRNIKTNVIEYASDSISDLFDVNEDNLLKGEKFYFNNIYPKDKDAVGKAMNSKAYKDNKSIDIEYRITDKNDKLIWLRTRGFIIRQGQTPIYSVGITEEITNKKEVELSLAKNLEVEKSLNEHKSYFISMVSHQFRTPLTIIQTNSELIDFVSEQQKVSVEKYTTRIKSEVNRLTDILEDILIIEKSNKNKLGRRETKFSVLAILISIVEDYNIKRQTNPLTLNYSNTEPFYLIGDEVYFRHAMINLIDNAVKYTPSANDSPEINIELTSNFGIIKIIDFGIGIPKDEIKSLFKPFFRGTNTSSIKGSGLGLLIAKEFIEFLGGKIKVESALDKGTKIICQFERN